MSDMLRHEPFVEHLSTQKAPKLSKRDRHGTITLFTSPIASVLPDLVVLVIFDEQCELQST